jgi:two-component system, cell cycle sensor histidine kinase and response regulator CckA
MGAPRTVLVAEDDDIMRRLAARILSASGFNVLLAHDGAEAVELFRAHANEIGAVVLDAVMPKLSGLQACRQIRALHGTIPVLFLTGNADGLRDQSASILEKPYDPEMLVNAVNSLFEPE